MVSNAKIAAQKATTSTRIMSQSISSWMLTRLKTLFTSKQLLVLAMVGAFYYLYYFLKGNLKELFTQDYRQTKRYGKGGGGHSISDDFFYLKSAKQKFVDKACLYMGDVVHEVFSDSEVNRQGLNFLERLLCHPVTHEAGIVLLLNVLKDPRFVSRTDEFGTDLIAWVI